MTTKTRTIYAIKEGCVSKKGSKAFHPFRDRYMILWSNKRIEYYTNSSLETLKGNIDLKGLHRRFIQRSDKIPKTKNKNKNKNKPMYGFKIITNKRTWYLCVNDANLRDEWIQTIRDLIDDRLPNPNMPIKTTSTQNTNLLKSKINKIKLQNSTKWNQLIVATRTQQKQSNNANNLKNSRENVGKNTVHTTWNDCDQISNNIYSESEVGENTNNAENVELKERDETDEKHSIFMQKKCKNHNLGVGGFKFYENNDAEGSILGFSLSTTPILHPPNSPNVGKESRSGNRYCEFTDFWDLENAQSNKYIELSDETLNGIHCIKNKSRQWISCFGAKIVENGECWQWRIKILPYDNDNGNGNDNDIANVVIGICDVEIVKQKHIKYGGFWSLPYFGYGYGGISGNKFDANKKSKIYGKRYKINDIIAVDLNNNKLMFMCNNINNGIAFNVDNKRNYVLAVAFCNNRYDLQIYD